MDHNAADAVVGEEKYFLADFPTLLLDFAQSLQLQSLYSYRFGYGCAVGRHRVLEGILQFLLQLLQVFPQISIHHKDSFLNCIHAVVWEGWDAVFARQVGTVV